MPEIYLNLMGHNSLHSLSLKNVFELCTIIIKSIATNAGDVLFMNKPMERSKFNNYYARLKWNMSVLMRAMTNVEDIPLMLKISDITMKYENENRETSEIRVDITPATFQIIGPSAMIKILTIVFEKVTKFLSDKLLMTPRIKSAQNILLLDKCTELFESVALVMSNNVSKSYENLYAVKKDTIFTFFEVKVEVGNVTTQWNN